MSIVAAFAVPHPPIIMPEIEPGEERKIEKTDRAYREAMKRAAAFEPETVIVTTPHSIMYADYFHISPQHGKAAQGSFARFGAPSVRIEAEYDAEFIDALCADCRETGIMAGTLGERDPELDHATMIPLRYLQEFYTDFRLVRIGLSDYPPLTHYELGRSIARVSERLGRRAVFIASGDLSHKLREDGPYGYAKEGPQFDSEITKLLADADFSGMLGLDREMCDSAAECGLRSFWIMAGALDRKAVDAELLSYEGPFGVGYGVASFIVTGDDASRCEGDKYVEAEMRRISDRRSGEDPYVRLARLSLETYVKTGRRIRIPEDIPPGLLGAMDSALLHDRAGAFVSLKKYGRLRGCIGTIGATQDDLALEIAANAVSAAVNDPRFDPVSAAELNELVYSVDVLGEPEDIADEAELDPARYGVIVRNGNRRGLLLPDLEGVDTPAEQIRISRQKAGIRSDEPVQLQRFEVVRHH